jgi:hypothetical protein
MARLTANSSDAYPQTSRRRNAVSRLRLSLRLKCLSVAGSMGWPESVKECRRCVANTFGLVGYRLKEEQRHILTAMSADFADSLGGKVFRPIPGSLCVAFRGIKCRITEGESMIRPALLRRVSRSAAMAGWLILLACIPLAAQEQSAASGTNSISADALAKFAFGKSIYVKNEHGSDVAFEVINSDIEGWGRFTMLNLPEKADLTAEITSYDAGGFRVGGNPVYSAEGKPQDSMGARRDLSPASVTLKVYDAKTKRELWSGTEKVKSAFKKKAQEDNVVASAQKLFLRFHDFVQPPGT